MVAQHLALLPMGPWTGISCCVVVAQQPHSPEPTSAAEVAFPMALSPVIFQAMAACPEDLGYGPHALASWARDLVMAVSHCLAAEKPSPWALSLDHQVAAPCLSTSKLSHMAWRMILGAWLPMTREVLTWSPTIAQQHGGDLSMGRASVPGELLLLVPVVVPLRGNPIFRSAVTEYRTGHQATVQFELVSSLLKDSSQKRPGMIGMNL